MHSSAGFAVIGASLSWSLACGAPHAPQPPSESPEPTASAPEPTVAAARVEIPPRRWVEESATWPTVVESIATQHLAVRGATPSGDPPNARIRVSPDAEDAYRTWSRGSRLPPGAVLVSELHDAAGELLWRFAMEREVSHWRFEILGPDGRVLHSEHAGACATCHEQATSQSVFGPSRP